MLDLAHRMRNFLTILTTVATCLVSATALAQATPEETALLTAHQLAQGRFSDIPHAFTTDMASALPAERLAQVWANLVATVGPLRDTGTPHSVQAGTATIVTVPLRHERGTFDLVVTVAGGKIAGLFIRPAQASSAAPASGPRANTAAYRDVEVTVGAAPTPLPGTLTLPQAMGKVAAVILVHGSGPNDRNETVGANRPFQDLAEGLAARGIAVLRYEKRTKAYPQSFGPAQAFTVREEVTDDAEAAIALLRARAEIDPGRIVVLGHSLGGTLAPRIAKEDPAVAGIILLAAAARPIPELLVEQTEYLASLLDGPPDEALKARIAALKVEADRALAAKPGDTGAPIFNIPPAYWADLNAYDPAATAATLTLPMLILQGRRDYQVSSKDFERFRSALVGRANVKLKMLPRLNHIFIAGDGRSTPADYAEPGHVDAAVIDMIATFVSGLPAS
jgi:dienelactone hydrolase